MLAVFGIISRMSCAARCSNQAAIRAQIASEAARAVHRRSGHVGPLSASEPAGRPGDWQGDRLKVFRRFLARTPKSLARNNKTWTPKAVIDALPTGQGCVDDCNDAELRQYMPTVPELGQAQ
jgi:hypothetical protein